MDKIINLDQWFDKFDPFRDYARTCSYEGEVNPDGGFGISSGDGRLVLTCFVDLERPNES